MKDFIGTMTVRLKGLNAADAVQRLINPAIEGTEAEITSMSVFENNEITPPQGQTIAWSQEQDPRSFDPVEPDPIPNEGPALVQDVTEPEPEEEDCEGCPEAENTNVMELPNDFPYVGTLRREGESLDSVILKTQGGTLKDVKGIGATAVEKITDYLQRTGRLPSPGTTAVTSSPATEPSVPEPEQEESVSPPQPQAEVPTTVNNSNSSAPEKAEVRQALAEVAQKHKLPALKDLLKEFNATSLGDLAEEHYPAAFVKAKELLGG